jgi:hypothetical protein
VRAAGPQKRVGYFKPPSSIGRDMNAPDVSSRRFISGPSLPFAPEAHVAQSLILSAMSVALPTILRVIVEPPVLPWADGATGDDVLGSHRGVALRWSPKSCSTLMCSLFASRSNRSDRRRCIFLIAASCLSCSCRRASLISASRRLFLWNTDSATSRGLALIFSCFSGDASITRKAIRSS